MFSTLSKTNFNFSGKFILSSANAFSFDQSKVLSFGKELKKALSLKTGLHVKFSFLQNDLQTCQSRDDI